MVLLPVAPAAVYGLHRRPTKALPSLARSAFQLSILSIVLGGASTARTFLTM